MYSAPGTGNSCVYWTAHRKVQLKSEIYILSRPDLRAFYVSILVWSGGDLCGHSMFFFLCFCSSLFWPGMVLNQGQLSIVVSDW